MNIEIELIIVIIIILLLVVFFLWYKLSQWLSIKFYKENNDKSKIGETKRRAAIEEARNANPDTSKAVIDLPGSVPTERRELLQDAGTNPIGENSTPVRSNNRSTQVRGFFSRFNRR